MDIILYTLLVPWNYPFLSILLLLMGLLLQIKFMIKRRKEKEKTLKKFSKSAITIVAVSVIFGLYWGWRILLPHTIFYSNVVSRIKYHGYDNNFKSYFKGETIKKEDINEILTFLSKGYIMPGAFTGPPRIKEIEFYDNNEKIIKRFYFGIDYLSPYDTSIITEYDVYLPVKNGISEWLLTHSTPCSSEEYNQLIQLGVNSGDAIPNSKK